VVSEMMLDRLIADAHSEPLQWWWLSFADSDLPTGEQFLGAAVVRARGLGHAALVAHRLGINPGGEVLGATLPDGFAPPPEQQNRLMAREEAEAFEPIRDPTPQSGEGG
jgi:hypothetical protein